MKTRKSFKLVLRNAIVQFSIILVAVSALVMYGLLNFVGASLIERQNARTNQDIQQTLAFQLQEYEAFIDSYFVNPIAYMSLEVLSNENAVYELLYHFVNQQEIKSVFYIVSPEGQTLFTNAINESPYQSSDIFLTGIFRQLKRNPSTTITALNKIQFQNNYRTVYSMGRGIIQNKEVMAYLLFDFLESDLNALIQSSNVDAVILTDQYENTIVSTTNALMDNLGKFKPVITPNQEVLIRDVAHIISASSLLDGRIKVYTLSSLGFLDDFFLSSLSVLMVFVMISAMVIWFASQRYANTKTQALDELLRAIGDVQQGDLSTRVNIKSGDEFEELGLYFNRMLGNLADLIVENNELMSRTNLSEIKQLQAQFNPHFLFNALESFKYLIRTNTQDAEVFILRLAQLLRYSIQTGGDFVKLKDDLDYIKTYLDIQALRYGSRFSYDLQVDEKVESTFIPKLILQPIIENSFQHGDTEGRLRIHIQAYQKAQQLIISITDNGRGLSPSSLKQLRKRLNHDENLDNHLGLFNVHRRIQLHYGMNFGLRLKHRKEGGLHIQIHLPLHMEFAHA